MRKFKKLIRDPKLFFSDMSAKKKGKLTKQEEKKIMKVNDAVGKNKKNITLKEKVSRGNLSEIKTPRDVVAEIKISNPNETLLIHLVSTYKPINHVIHIGEGLTHGPSQLKLWIPYFIQSKEYFAILIRHRDLYEYIKKIYPYINVIYARNSEDVEKTLNSFSYLKVIYYLSNTGNLIHTLRYNIYTHVFLGHGDSDKSASAHKFFRVYDQIWVAGQGHIDRFYNADFKTNSIKFIKVGRPALKEVISHFDMQTTQNEELKVLYLPTWEGVYEENNYSSVELAKSLLLGLQIRYKCYISVKFHPVTGTRKKSLLEIEENLISALHKNDPSKYYIENKNEGLNQLIMNANCFICDISAVVSECIAANKPLFVYIPNDKDVKASLSNMNYSDYAYTFSSVEELNMLFEKVVVKGQDILKQSRTKARDYLISINETTNDAFIKELREIDFENRNQKNLVLSVNQ